VRILLDTHVALWAITASPRLTASARDIIIGADAVYVSAVSLWEIAIKRAVKRDAMPVSAQDAERYFSTAGYGFLPITSKHAVAVESLPMHHNDPFDRMLIAQALLEPLRLITSDQAIAAYSDMVILA
jgi:PIN domain nuclease of toxin-antitoxin system